MRIIRQAAERGRSTSVILLQSIYKQEGINGLWKGNAVNLSRAVPAYAVRFTVFGNLSEYSKTFPLLGNPFVSGSISGLASTLASYPLDMLRTRISIGETLSQAFKRGRLYAGCSLAIIEMMPYSSLTLGTYHYLTRDAERPTNKILAGFIAGVLGTLICFPLDTLRRNKIIEPHLSVFEIAKTLAYSGGFRRYYRGLSVALIKTAPTVTLTMTLNDFLLHKFNVI